MSTYYATLTAVGAAKIANAQALGEVVQITHMAVGDGNGATPMPSPAQTALVNELRRAPINMLDVDPLNPAQIIIEQVIPENVGGWWIRELGAFDADGDLVAVANAPDTYKPLLAEGSGRTQVIRMVLVVSSTAAVQLKIDPSVVLAPRAYVDAKVLVVAQALQAHMIAGDPHPQYLTQEEAHQLYLPVLGTVPSVQSAALIYVPPYGVMAWSATHGIYRSVECGQLVIHTAPTAKPGTVKANGGLLSKSAYAGLWSQAQDDGLVVTAGNWLAGHWHYEDVDAGTFRVPDVRGEFPRFWDDGRGVDPGRVFGSSQGDEIKSHNHSISGQQSTGGEKKILFASSGSGTNGAVGAAGGAETRPRNVALTPCIHI